MEKIKLLVDLKPALDGYAGIPQESRLLFAALRRLGQAFDVEGLLQHGSGFIATQNTGEKELPPHEKAIADSRTVASFCQNAAKTYLPGLPKFCQRFIALQILRWHAFRNKPVHMGVFETDMFDDFIWRHLFAKSLRVSEKELLTSSRFRIINHSRKAFHQVGLKGFGNFGCARYPKLNTTGYDFLLAHTPFPARVSRDTRLVIRYHDAIPIFMPHTINNISFHQASHYKALKDNVDAGAFFVCSSEATRSDLLKIFPHIEPRATVIHNIISDEYYVSDEPAHVVSGIVVSRSLAAHARAEIVPQKQSDDSLAGNYLLMVSTLEPRKNHRLLIAAWERLKYSSMPDLKLILVGSKGWNYELILDAMRPGMQRGDLFHLVNVPHHELRVLYRHAAATVCPALAEGFDYTGVEAMSCGAVVVASDIPVHREIYRDAAIYFNPYSVDDAARTIGGVLADEADHIREKLKASSRKNSERYREVNISSKWEAFFEGLKSHR